MATPKDKLTKAHEQKAHTDTSAAHRQKAPWQEALDRHVTVPASRSTEAAEVFRDFAGSWAASYEMGTGASTQQQGSTGVPALQRKTNRLGQPGLPEINFRPYDWGTHRFGPKGPSLLGHPISFEIVGPTHKTKSNDFQWALTDNAGGALGDVLTLDMAAADDVSCRSVIGGGATQTDVQILIGGGATDLTDYYGNLSLTDYPGGLYMVITSGGRAGTLTGPAGFGGPGDGQVGDPVGGGNRVGILANNIHSKSEIFRITGLDVGAKSITLDPVKHISDFFDVTGAVPIIRSIMLMAPKATRLVAAPGSGGSTGATSFVVVPPERALLNEYQPTAAAYYKIASGLGGAHDPWVADYGANPTDGLEETYFFRPMLPIETPLEISTAVQWGSFTSAPAIVTTRPPRILLHLDSGHVPAEKTAVNRLVNIHEIELYGAAATHDPGGAGAALVADPGYEWLMGHHEVVDETEVGSSVTNLWLHRVPEVNPVTGVPWYTPPDALDTAYTPITVNDGMRFKLSWHDPVESLWLSPHASLDKISQARLTNLINPDWLSKAHSLKQLGTDSPDTAPFVRSQPDKAIFDTSSSSLGASGSNANPGNLMDLGFRMVLFAAQDGGAGFLTPDFNNPIDARDVVIDPTKLTEEQWWDVDYSSGLVTLSHAPQVGGVFTPTALAIPQKVVGPFPTGGQGLTWDDGGGGGPHTITRNDPGGSFVTDGFKPSRRFTVTAANTPGNNQTYTIGDAATDVTATVLTVHTPTDAKGVPVTNDVDDNVAIITSGDNPRGEVVVFASCVPYSREAGQLGANLRVTAGQNDVLNLGCNTGPGGPSADVFSERIYWQLAGDNATPQTITSGEQQSIDLLATLLPTEMPSDGHIEIIAGLDPEGPPAFFDATRRSVSTFGYTNNGATHGGGGTTLENVHGGIGVTTITVDSDNPFIAVLRRDIVLPSGLNGGVGTDYSHDVTYGASSRATALRFKHAKLTKQIDGSVVVEGLDELAKVHEKLFDDLLSSWVIDGFTFTTAGTTVADFTAGTVLLSGVRSEMAPAAFLLPAGAGEYYVYIEPQGGDPACPAFAQSSEMPLPNATDVLVGLATVAGGVITNFDDLRRPMTDINLRDDILVGLPPAGHPTIAAGQPHFDNLSDAVKYACELMTYRAPAAAGDALGRYQRIKVVGPTNEAVGKLPIVFTSDGIIIEGAAARVDGTGGAVGIGVANQQSIAWAEDTPLFDLNGHSNLQFRNLVLEYRDTGQAKVGSLLRAAFVNRAGGASICSGIQMEGCYLIGLNESATAIPNVADAFVHFTSGNAVDWTIRDCWTQSNDAGIYFGGDQTRGETCDTVSDLLVENCTVTGYWNLGLSTTTGAAQIQQMAGWNLGLQPETHGGVVIVTKTLSDNCKVVNNRIQRWAGYGIIDNMATNALYSGNTLDEIGDAPVWTCANPLFYAAQGGQNRVVNNILQRVHALAIAGGAGAINQAAVAAAAWAEKRGIYVDDSIDSFVLGNYVEINGATAADDADLYVAGIDVTALGNAFVTSGVKCEAAAVDFILGGGHIAGQINTLGVRSIVSALTVDGLVQVAAQSAVADCHLKDGLTSVGADGLVVGNRIEDPAVSSGLIFDTGCIIANNIYNGVGDGASIDLAANCLFTGNRCPTGEVKISGDDVSMVGNLVESVEFEATLGAGTTEGLTFVGNQWVDLRFILLTRDFNNCTFVGNFGPVFLNSASANQTSDENVVVGNCMMSPGAAGVSNFIICGSNNVISGNYIDGYLTVGLTNSVADTNIISNNRVTAGRDIGIVIPDSGGTAGNFFASIEVFGAESVVNGNLCAHGIHLPVASTQAVLTGNRFGSDFGASGNGSSLFVGDDHVITGNHWDNGVTGQDTCIDIQGDNNLFNGNSTSEGLIKVTGIDVVISSNLLGSNETPASKIEVGAVRCIVQGNHLHGELRVLGTGDSSSIKNNLLDKDGDDIIVDTGAAGVSICGNHLPGAGSQILSDGANGVIVGNWVADNINITVNGVRTLVSGNRVEGDLLAVAADMAITGNFVGGTTGLKSDGIDSVIGNNRVDGGDLIINGDDSTVTGNQTQGVTGDMTVTADNVAINGNRIHGAGLITATSVRPVISGNFFNAALTALDVLDYVIVGNMIIGDLIVDDVDSVTPQPGIIIGNFANRISGTAAAHGGLIFATGMVVLGNKVATGNRVFNVATGTDSVGLNAANQIIDFNVSA